MSSRKPISKKTRFEIFKRDGFVCAYCGAHPPTVALEVDHIHPVALGGDNDPDSLVTSCERCNRGKSATPLSAVPESLSNKAARVAEMEAQLAGYVEVMDRARRRIEHDVWRVAEELRPGAEAGYPTDRYNSIKAFLRALDVHEVLDAADVTMAKGFRSEAKAFKYFCGVCWTKIRGSANG